MKASLSDFKRNSIERFRSNLRTTGSDSKSNRRVVAGTVGLNSFPVEVHGQQQGGNYNGYYRCTAYHPLVASFLVRCDYDSTREGLRLGIDLGGRRLTRFENRTVVFGGLRYWPDPVLEVRIAEERDVEDFRALLKSIARSEIESEFAMSYQ